MPYVIKVTDPRRHPGRVGWMGKSNTRTEGAEPVGIAPFLHRVRADWLAKQVRGSFPSATIEVMELRKKGARK